MAYHNPIPTTLNKQAVLKFWASVLIRGTEECWEWQKDRSHNGYGRFLFKKKRYASHRVSYFLVNPRHLFLGTSFDNNRDMKLKGRAASGDRNPSRLYPERYIKNRPKGGRCGTAKVTEDQVREMRRLFDANLHSSYKLLGEQFGLTVGPTFAIVHRHTWIHVT